MMFHEELATEHGGDSHFFHSQMDTWDEEEQPGPAAIAPKQITSLDRFRLGRILGEGGMGIVYEAYDTRLKRQVALKLLKKASPRGLRRFAVEARLQASVDHANVCKVFEVGETREQAYIVMPLIHGVTLEALLTQLDLETKLRILVAVAEGVHHTHRQGLLHRDLKPANIMVETEDGAYHPFITDFGLARSMEENAMTQTGAIMGTPYYMAPEQAIAGAIDARGDVYALGATLYQIICGRPPYHERTAPQIIHAFQHESGPDMTLAGVPEKLVIICRKAMEINPDRRYQTAQELGKELQRYLDHKPIRAKPPGLIYRARLAVRRNKTLEWALMLASMVMAWIAVYLGWHQWQAEREVRQIQEITEQLGQMKSLHRTIMMTREHDVRAGLAEIRARMENIRKDVDRLGMPMFLTALYAMGEMHLVLGELEEARGYLEEAWRLGRRDTQTARTLGWVLAGLYERSRQIEFELRGMGQADESEELSELRRAAGQYLVEAGGENRAEVAYLDGRFKEALTSLPPVTAQPAWRYELDIMRGNILRELARNAAEQGRRSQTLDYRDAAEQAYLRALDTGKSDGRIYRERALLWLHLARSRGLDVCERETSKLRGLECTSAALRINPDDPLARKLTQELRRMTSYPEGQLINPPPTSGNDREAVTMRSMGDGIPVGSL